MRDILRSIDAAVRAKPLRYGVAIATTKAVGADAFAQRVLEGKTSWDMQRAFVFANFGFLYCGTLQHFIYAVGYPRLEMLLPMRRPWGALSILLVDQLVQACALCALCRPTLTCTQGLAAEPWKLCRRQVPFVYYPVFYFSNALVDASQGSRQLSVCNVGSTWRENVLQDMKACALFWIPANGFNFLHVPPHWRVPYIAGVGYFWLAYLSWSRGRQLSEQRVTLS